MTREGVNKQGKRWYPELFYVFGTAVIIDLETNEILFTRAKDREQWVPSAGGEMIIPADTSQPIFIQSTAIKETGEELYAKTDSGGEPIGLQIILLGPDAFHSQLHCGELSIYTDADSDDPIQMGLFYYLAVLEDPTDKDKIQSRKQPGEEDCETIGIEWMTIDAFLAEVESGKKETFPNVIPMLHKLQAVLAEKENPFRKPWGMGTP